MAGAGDDASAAMDDTVGEMVVNPWEATGNMNYDKLIEQFGSQAISPALVDRFERVTGKRAHTWIRVRLSQRRLLIHSGTVGTLAGVIGHTLVTASLAPQRGIFFSHRDLDKILDLHEKKQPMYLYTGRGPSSEALHLGHLIPFHFTKYLQDVFQCPLVSAPKDERGEKGAGRRRRVAAAGMDSQCSSSKVIACWTANACRHSSGFTPGCPTPPVPS